MKLCVVGLGNHYQNSIEKQIINKNLKVHSVITLKKKINVKVKIFNDLKTALKFYKNEIVIFYLCTPPDIHIKYLKILKSSNHIVICEKPIFLSLKDFNKFYSKKNIFEMMPYRLSKQYKYFKKLFSSQSDNIKKIVINFSIPKLKFKSYRNSLENSLIIDQLCYPIDTLNDLNININKIELLKFNKRFFNKSKLSLKLNNYIFIDISRGYKYKNNLTLCFKNKTLIFDYFFYAKQINKNIIDNTGLIVKSFNENDLFIKFIKYVNNNKLENSKIHMFKNIKLLTKILEITKK